VAAANFGWFGGSPIFFSRRQRIAFSAGGCGWIRRLKGLGLSLKFFGILVLTPSEQ